jgi:PAS domain S-box-containing protein
MQTKGFTIRVLLIDDDRDDFYLIRDLLSQISLQRYELEWLADFDAALEALVRGPFDVCLLDYRLGPKSGFDLLKEALSRGCIIPVILLTGVGDYSVDLESMQAGAADYLAKDELSANVLERSIRHSVDQMRVNLELRKSRDRLEEHVRKRTEELLRANEALQESELFTRSTLDAISAHIAILDENGIILRTNLSWENFAKTNGFVDFDFQGVNYLSVCDHATGEWAEEASVVATGIREVISGTRDLFELEYPCHSRDEKQWFNMRVTRFKDYASPRVVLTHENITESKTAEAALRSSESRVRHLNDVLRAIKDISGILNREKDPGKLLTDVCNSLAQTRGYVMVWIGRPEAGSKRVVPVAHSGVGSGFLEHSLITWDDSPSGQGPAGTAMRERRPTFFGDLANDPRFTLWKEPVIAYGGASIASVPLIYRERLFGVLTVKADQTQAFDAEEIDHLSGLAADIARRLQSLEDETARKQAEQSLRESEARMVSIFRAAPIGIGLASNRVILDANDSLCNIVGYSRDELLGKNGRMLYPDEREYEYVGLEKYQMIRESGTGTVETRFRRKDGKIIDVLLSSTPLDSTDLSAGVTFTVLDITKRKQAERELSRYRDHLEALVKERTAELAVTNERLKHEIEDRKRAEQGLRDSEKDLNRAQFVAKTGSWRLDVLNNELIWSDETHRIFDVQKGTPLTYEEFLTHVHPEDRHVVDRKWSVALLGGEYDVEHRIVVGDRIKWVRERAELEFDEKGTLLGGFGTVQDITERKQAEEALRESQQILQVVLNTIPVRVFWKDLDSNYLGCNSPFAFDAGLQSPMEIAGRNDFEMGWTEQAQLYISDDRTVIETGKAKLGYEEPQTTPSGDRIWLRTSKVPLFDIEGRIKGVLGTYEDITARKQAEEALQKAHDELERRVEERTAELEKANKELRQIPSRLISVQEEERKRLASELHDSIGQTLAAVKFWVEMSLKLRDEGNWSSALDHLEQFVPILKRSIEETRNIYMGLRPSMLDKMGLLATLEWLRRECMRFYPGRHIELEAHIAEEEIPESLKINIFRIAQEALNNIAKHSKAEWVDISLLMAGDWIELAVSDDGLGMDVSQILQTSTATSLGLTSMRERAELTGGRFSIESALGKGTTIRASWPIEAENQLQKGGITQ